MEQLTFADALFQDLDSEAEQAHLPPGKLRQAALAWLASEQADAVGLDVATNYKRFRAPVGAFWASPERPAARSMLLELKPSRDACWPDHVQSQNLLPELRELKRERITLEAEIRQAEPHLRCSESLFEEYAEWHYDKSQNLEYVKLSEQISRVQAAIYRGTRFERLASARMANELYLVIPKGAVQGYELAEGWGLLWVDDNLQISVEVPAPQHHCQQENIDRFAASIAIAGKGSVLFTAGIELRGEAPEISRPPRRRRRPKP